MDVEKERGQNNERRDDAEDGWRVRDGGQEGWMGGCL